MGTVEQGTTKPYPPYLEPRDRPTERHVEIGRQAETSWYQVSYVFVWNDYIFLILTLLSSLPSSPNNHPLSSSCLIMKQKVIAWSCLALTFLCSLRACHLYWSSTRDLRSADLGWRPFRHSKVDMPQRSMDDDGGNYLGDQPNGLFYFTQVKKKEEG